ncbi:unnamed protein product [Larinioides sclopetarius]|uniref:Fibronectin type-III domain-containing protein n=1 Tax=Larinioides sclopetarius TaxID=280406 RepID=A0AAV2B9Q1_9ARAC
MEAEQKTETAEKEGEKREIEMIAAIKAEKIESEDEKMEVDIEPVETVVEEKEDFRPLILKVEATCEDLVTLKIEGIETGDDDDEEFVVMSPEEIRLFLEQKISEHVRDPQINPLLALEKRTNDLLDEIKDKADEISRLSKALDMLYRNQERFLRHMDIFPKVPTNSVSVSVDLPLLMDSVPLMSPSKVQDEEAVIKKDLSDAKVLSPSVSRAKPSTPVPTSIPPVPSGISVTPVPSTSSSTPAVPKASPAAPASNLTTTVKTLPKLPPKPAGDIECIDLTDDPPVAKPITNLSPLAAISLVKHPAPLPPRPFCPPNSSLPNVPPKPRLKISSEERGIVLQWDMPPCYSAVTAYSKLKSFDIFGYQEQKNVVINTLLWKKIGAVKAMNLPMACTLTQFVEGQKYHFAIRAVDAYDRCGSYSDPISIVYRPNNPKKA